MSGPPTKAEPQDSQFSQLLLELCPGPCSSIFIWFFVNRTVYRSVFCSPHLGLWALGSRQRETLKKSESTSSLHKPSRVKDWLIQTKAMAK